MKTTLLATCGALVGSLFLTLASPAHAAVADCGNINLEARATCEVVPPGVQCEAECENLSFEAACEVEVDVECRGECSASAQASCTGTCEADCQGQCTANPPMFECQAQCEAEANAHCQGECNASANMGECQASCRATFEGECSASCEGTPPSASCEAKCEAKCEGQCKAEVNVDCQVMCRNESFADCRARLEGGCTADCDTQEGALKCDNEYVDYENNLKNCIDALKAELNITGSATAHCENNRCEAEASGSASCAMRPATGSSSGLELLALGTLLAAAFGRRRRP